MAERFYLKQHDLLPALRVRLLDETTPVDLTNATSVKMLMKSRRSGLKVNAPMTIDANRTLGVVSYAWQIGDTDTAGDYNAEFQVTWPTGKPQTFPARGHVIITIEKDLDGS
jgi:hypothetical protein